MSDIDEVHAEAEDAAAVFSPARVFLTVVLGIFTGIGWLWGRGWYLLFFATAAIRFGYYNGMKITPEVRAARLSAKRAKRAAQKPQPRQ